MTMPDGQRTRCRALHPRTGRRRRHHGHHRRAGCRRSSGRRPPSASRSTSSSPSRSRPSASVSSSTADYRQRAADAAGEATQAEIDALLGALRPAASASLPKGLAPATLDRVAAVARAAGAISAAEAAERLGMSRVAARRYLEHLADEKRVDRSARYGTPGSPRDGVRLALIGGRAAIGGGRDRRAHDGAMTIEDAASRPRRLRPRLPRRCRCRCRSPSASPMTRRPRVPALHCHPRHGSRELAAVTGVNIDGAALQDLPRTGEWHLDDRVPASDQTGPAVYAANDLDRGHLVRRRDPGWGSGGSRPRRDRGDLRLHERRAAGGRASTSRRSSGSASKTTSCSMPTRMTTACRSSPRPCWPSMTRRIAASVCPAILEGRGLGDGATVTLAAAGFVLDQSELHRARRGGRSRVAAARRLPHVPGADRRHRGARGRRLRSARRGGRAGSPHARARLGEVALSDWARRHPPDGRSGWRATLRLTWQSGRMTTIDLDGLSAYRAAPAGAPRGGIILIHEIWGLVPHITTSPTGSPPRATS